MGVETWNKPLTEIDNTYGYNDMLLMPGGGAMPITVRDRLAEADTASVSHPSGAISDFDAGRIALPGDQLYRLPNGGLLLRRSVFNDPCQAGSSRPNNSLLISEPMSRALAFFGANYQGSDPSGDLWCRRSVPGTAGSVETAWDVSSMGSLRSIEEVLSRIASTRDGHIPSDLQPAQHTLAKELATALRPDELKALSSDISKRIDRLKSAGDLFMKHPVLHTLGIAILFGLGTDVYHIARYALFGGESPFKGAGRGLFTRLYQGIRKLFDKGPKDPPPSQGGSGGGHKDLPLIPMNEIPADASFANGFVIQGGQVIGVASAKRETLPEGVVTPDEGSLIYAPEYHAWIDGSLVALPPDSGFQSLAGGSYTRAEFLQRIEGSPLPSTLFASGTELNYGALGYAQSTHNALALPHGVATPNFRVGAVPLTFGSGQAATFRAPSLVIRPALVPVR